jgi:hypothetical protein
MVYIGVAYYTGVFPDPDWTGFGTPKVDAQGKELPHFKTLWDWLGLLLIPLVLAIGGYFLTRSENRYALQLQQRREEEARKIEEQRILEAREIEKARTQDAALQAYLDQMTQLLLDKNCEHLNQTTRYGASRGREHWRCSECLMAREKLRCWHSSMRRVWLEALRKTTRASPLRFLMQS